MEIGKLIKYMFWVSMLTVTGLILFVFCLWFFRNFENAPDVLFGKTDIGGTYYLSFIYENNEIKRAQISYNKIVYEEPIDLTGIEVLLEPNKVIPIESDIIYDDAAIRQKLLDMGYARIAGAEDKISHVSEDTATTHYSENQDTIVLHNYLQKIYDIAASRAWIIIRWLLISAIGLSTIFSIIVKMLKSIRINVVFFGSISSGKTTLIRRIVWPNISEAKLTNDITPTELAKRIKGKRIAQGNKDIYPSWVDNPGNALGDMIDDVLGKGKVLFARNIGVYVLAPTPGCENDTVIKIEYKRREITRALTTIKALKKTESLRTPSKIVLFINKMDLVYDDEDNFLKKKEKALESYIEDEEFDELIEMVDDVIFGSALKNWEIDTLLSSIIER